MKVARPPEPLTLSGAELYDEAQHDGDCLLVVASVAVVALGLSPQPAGVSAREEAGLAASGLRARSGRQGSVRCFVGEIDAGTTRRAPSGREVGEVGEFPVSKLDGHTQLSDRGRSEMTDEGPAPRR